MKRKRRRAFILAAVFFIMVVIILLVAALFRLVPQEIRWSSDHRRETLAYYTATGGVKHAMAWLRSVRLSETQTREPFERTADSEPYRAITVPNPSARPLSLRPSSDPNPDGLETFFPAGMPALHSRPGRIRLSGDWTAEVYIFPDKKTFPHPALNGGLGTLAPCYTLVSLAFRDTNGNGICDLGIGGESYATRVETSVVERTFARYAYFVDRWRDEGANTTRMGVFPGIPFALFSGPFHSNDTPVIEVHDAGTFWAQNPNTFPPPFSSEISFSGDEVDPRKAPDSFDGLAYWGGNFRGISELLRPYTGGGPFNSEESRYRRLFKQGQQAIRRTQRIELPNNWSRMARAAWGAESGREVAVDAAGANQVFINHEDLGIAVTGSLQEFRLDVVDPQGNSVVFDGSGQVRPNPGTGQAAIRMTQANPVLYVSGETTVDITATRVESTTGPYSITRTLVSDVEQPGYSPQVVDRVVSMTTTTVPRTIPVSTTYVNDPPGGPGPSGGGSIPIVSYTTQDVEIQVPVTEPHTQYVMVEVETGDGPYDITLTDVVGQETVPVIETYFAQDAVVTAKDGAVNFPVNYFLASSLPLSQFPVLIDEGGAAGVNITIPEGRSAVVRQDRLTGETFSVKLLDGEPSGVVGVYGQIQELKGVNRGSKNIVAFAGAPSLDPTGLSPISITDHLLQHGLPRGDQPTSGNNTLGVIGSRITLPSDPTILARFPDESRALFLYASLLAAQGSFVSETLLPGAPLAQVRVIGGVLQQEIGKLVVGGRGWASRYIYDRFQAIQPPPAFPPDGRYDVTFFRVTAP